MNGEEKKKIELDIEAKYVDKTEKEFLSRLTYAECLYILTPENEYCDEVIKLSVLKIREIIEKLQKENEQLHKFILEGITIENSPFQNYQLDILRENFIPIWRIKNLIKELKQDDIDMTRKYKEKKNITGELLGIDKVRVRAYREKTREIKEKLQKLLSDWKKEK